MHRCITLQCILWQVMLSNLIYKCVFLKILLNKPKVCPLHAERDFDRLNLFEHFQTCELLSVFDLERRKTLSFLTRLKKEDWSKELIEENKKRQETIYWRARGFAIHDYTHFYILNFQLGEFG